MLKKGYLFFIIIVCLFAISAVGAEEIDNGSNITIDYNSDIGFEYADNNLLLNSIGTFEELQDEIINVESGGTLNLTKDYEYVDGSTDGIIITNVITIDGQGHTLNGNYLSRILCVDANNVTLKNINFINGKCYMGSAIYFNNSGIINNCNFINNAVNDSYGYGGAIYFKSQGTVNYCNFSNNAAKYGGAIYFDSSTERSFISYSKFINNSATFGGAIDFHAPGFINYCIFINNSVDPGYAGAIRFRSDGNVYNSNFTSNYAFLDIDSCYGGAISFESVGNVYNCNFVNNSADSNYGGGGGAFSMYSGTVNYCNFNNNIAKTGGAFICFFEGNVTNCKFNNNIARMRGGAFSMYSGTVNNSSFKNNIASGDGGAFSMYSGTVNNSSFKNNIAKNDGGAIYVLGNNGIITNSNFTGNVANKGGAINVNGTNYVVDNSIFDYNNASSGGAVYWNGNEGFLGYSTFRENTVLDSGGAVYWAGDNGLLNCDDFENNYTQHNDFIIVGNNVRVLNLDITAPDLIKYYDGPERFVVTVKENNAPVVSKDVTINLNGVSYTRTTNSNGQVSMVINLNTGVYKVTSEFEGVKVQSTITVLPTVIGYDIVKIYKNGTQYYATFLDSEGNYLYEGTHVQFNLDNYFYEQRIIDNNGRAKLDINNKPGEYIITAINPVTGENIANLITVISNIVENYDSVKYYNESDKFSVRILESTGNPASGQKVKFTIGDTNYESTTNSNGYAFLNAILQPRTYTVTTTYGDLDANNTILILPTIYNHDMQVSSSDINAGENEVINIVLPKDATGKVNTIINDKQYSANVNNGNANIVVPDLNNGNYDIEVVYSGDSQYNSVKGKTSFFVKKTADLFAPDVTKYYKGSERFIVTLKDLNGKAINGAAVKININGNLYTRTTNENGITSMAINLNSGIYNVTTEYNGTKVYSTITIKSTISGNNVTKIYKNATQYYATFVDSNGNLLKNTDVKFNINGVFYTRKTNENGVAKMNINLNPGEYIITAENPNSGEKYTNLITVLPSIVEVHDLTKYYKNASKLTFRLLDDQGMPVGAGVSANININGVFYTRQTNASGYINMNINLNPGTYVATLEYNGLMASSTVKVLPILEAKDVTMRYKDGTKFEAKLLDGQGKAFAGQTITFNINGVFYDRTTDGNGIARLSINLMAGEYIITSMYSNGAAISNKITISNSNINTNSNTDMANLKSPEQQYFDILGPNGANGYVYYPDGTYEHFVNDIAVDGNHYVDKS